jgi:hypothetical protein
VIFTKGVAMAELPTEINRKYRDMLEEERQYQKLVKDQILGWRRIYLYTKGIGLFLLTAIALPLFITLLGVFIGFNGIIQAFLFVSGCISFVYLIVGGCIGGAIHYFIHPTHLRKRYISEVSDAVDMRIEWEDNQKRNNTKDFKQLKKEAKKRTEYIQFVEQLHSDTEFRSEFLKVYSEK